ncbi:Transmembrane protein, putative [Arachis hypogaea]|nr:Transmembrane protein, putative [Arachis hypogaea]
MSHRRPAAADATYLYGNVRTSPPFVYKLSFAQPTNAPNVEKSICFGNYYCYIVKPRVFAGCAILSFANVVFGIVYYVTLVEEKNCNNSCDSMYPNHGGIAMGQPQIPTQVSHDPVFVHEDKYVRRQIT